MSSLRESIDEWPKDIVRFPTKNLYEPAPFTPPDWKYIVKGISTPFHIEVLTLVLVTDAATKKYGSGAEVLGVGSNYYVFRVIRGEAEIKNGPKYKSGDFFGEMSLCLQVCPDFGKCTLWLTMN